VNLQREMQGTFPLNLLAIKLVGIKNGRRPSGGSQCETESRNNL